MATSRNIVETYGWTAAEVAPRSAGVKFRKQQTGFNRTTEPEGTVFTFDGRHQFNGKVLKRASSPSSWGYSPSSSGTAPYSGNAFLQNTLAQRTTAGNRAAEKLRQTVTGDSSAMGMFIAERREAFGLVASRTMGLYQAFRSLRKGRFLDFLRHLGLNRPKRRHRNLVRNAAEDASSLWLEYWFGWAPTVSDLYGLSSVIVGPPPSQRYTATARVKLARKTVRSASTYNFREETEWGDLWCKTGATFELTNPNLQLMQQLGLVNPATIAFESVPFSFVLDWFTNLGSVIDSCTWYVGMSIEDPFTTFLVKTEMEWLTGDSRNPLTWDTYYFRRANQLRSKALVRPSIKVPNFISDLTSSNTRAATAVSLLVQLMKS